MGCRVLADGNAADRFVGASLEQLHVLSRSKNWLSYLPMPPDHAGLLRDRGIQVTAQRLAVLRAVAGEPHITADRVAEIVRHEIGAISLQSVYDALHLLVSEGAIRRIQPAGSPARFEDRVADNHHHLICRLCGRIVDVECATGRAPCLTAADDKGYEIDEAEVAYWGRCPSCVAKSRSEAPSSKRDAKDNARTRVRGPREKRSEPQPRRRERQHD